MSLILPSIAVSGKLTHNRKVKKMVHVNQEIIYPIATAMTLKKKKNNIIPGHLLGGNSSSV